MIWKLALNGLKKKPKDYLILFAGSILAIAVFYMFLTLALNKEFILQNSMINNIQLVFIVGTVLLATITFFYLSYTNSFLLSLRKKEFGLYGLIGVKKQQLKRIFLIESIAITAFSLIIGTGLGVVLSGLVAVLLMNQLNTEFAAFEPFYVPAVLWTAAFFLGTAFFTATFHNVRLSKTSIIELLRADVQNDVLPPKRKSGAIQILLGLMFLAAGYIALIFMEFLRFIGLFAAPILTTLGTYLLFRSLLPLIIRQWKNNKRSNLKGINGFTLSQLSFRVNELKWVLPTIAMLIALSAGAISAGFAFKNDAILSTDQERLYDATLYNPGSAEERILQALPLAERLSYRFKTDGQSNYYIREELEAAPPLIVDWITYETKRAGALPETMEADESGYPLLPDDWVTAFEAIDPAFGSSGMAKIVSSTEYAEAPGEEITIVLARSTAFPQFLAEWQELDELQLKTFEGLPISFDPEYDSLPSKYAQFQSRYAFAGGTFFMGFFLGLAFLMMLASILMFKILSGSSSDIRRYENLRKIGVRKELLMKSISKEILIIFLFPAVIGLLHVAVGMRMFTFIIDQPYYRLWVSVLIFLAIYGAYYFFTVRLYRKLVLPE